MSFRHKSYIISLLELCVKVLLMFDCNSFGIFCLLDSQDIKKVVKWKHEKLSFISHEFKLSVKLQIDKRYSQILEIFGEIT